MTPSVPHRRRAGRPANPYHRRNPTWAPGATRAWFEDAFGSLPGTLRYKQTTRPDLSPDSAAAALIDIAGVPVTRRWLEKTLTVEHGYRPEEVTNALRTLRRDRRYILTEHLVDGFKHHVYSFGRDPLPSELKYLADLQLRAQSVFMAIMPETNRSYIGHAAEVFVARRLRRLGYDDVPKDGRLGLLVNADGEYPLDVSCADEEGTLWAIEVRNRHEVMFSDSRWIGEASKFARAHGREPWLVVAQASRSGRAECKRRGVRLSVLGAQILPATTLDGSDMRTTIAELRPILGPTPYHFMNTRNSPDDDRFDEALLAHGR